MKRSAAILLALGAASAAECDFRSMATTPGVNLTACLPLMQPTATLDMVCPCISKTSAADAGSFDCDYSFGSDTVNVKCIYDNCATDDWKQKCLGLDPDTSEPTPASIEPSPDVAAPTAAAPTAAAPTPATCDSVSQSLMKYLGVLTNPTDENVGDICNDDNGASFRSDLEAVLALCGAGEALTEVLDIVERTLCMKNKQESYCLVTLLNVLPTQDVVSQLIVKKFDVSTLDFYESLRDESKLDVICSEEQRGCTRKITRTAVDIMQDMGAGEYVDEVTDVAKATSAACRADNDGFRCMLQFDETFNEDGSLNTATACKNNKITKCARFLLGLIHAGDDYLDDPCGAAGEDADTVASAVLRLTNLKYDYLDVSKDQKEEVLSFILRDLAFNTGILGEEIDLKVEKAADDSVIVHIEIKGQYMTGAEAVEVLNSLAEHLEEHDVYFPNLDTEEGDAVLDQDIIISSAAILEDIVNEQGEVPTASGSTDTDPTDGKETESSAATATASLALILTAAFAAH